MVGPAIIRYGSAAQKACFLPATRRAELWWCQGYSEPQAGSDLASLATRAERDGDEYIVNGQKTWTSGAEHADWIFCLVRTNPAAQMQKGISFLLIDLASPGVTVTPLYAFNGKRLWNQVFFDNVRVPVTNRLGDEDRGWTVAKSLLGDERLRVSRVAENRRLLARVHETLELLPGTDAMRTRLSALGIRLEALEASSLRLLTLAGQWAIPNDSAGKTPSVGPADVEYIAAGRYHHRGYTIAGGSSEVQHNIIAKEVLGL